MNMKPYTYYTCIKAILPLLCLGMCGCSTEDNSLPSGGDITLSRTALCVSGKIDFPSSARVSDSSWERGDRIGIFMVETGKAPIATYIVGDAFNRNYAYYGTDGVFSPSAATDTIWFPQDVAQKVDFIAYYPYTQSVDSDNPSLSINLSASQTDYLYAARVSGCDRTKPAVSFSFAHLLGRVEVELIAGGGMDASALSGARVSLSGVPVSATCSLVDGSLAIDGNSSGTLPLAGNSTLVLPSSGAGRSLVISLPGVDEALSWELPSDKFFRAGESTVYHITLKTKAEEVPDDPVEPDDPDTPDDPAPDPQIELSVTSQVVDWIPGGSESGSAD